MKIPPRPDPKKVLELLIELNDTENVLIDKPRTTKRAAYEAEIAKLRAKLPKPILAHHDRIKLRRRTSVAIVRNWFCGSCHIEVPRGSHRTLQFANDLVVCENCGCYIHLPPTQEAETEAVAETIAKPKAKTTTRKKSALATA